jgi:hypothetical protein
MPGSSSHTAPSRARRIRRRVSVAVIPVMLTAALLGLLAIQARSLPVFRHHARPPVAAQRASHPLALGVTTTPLARNWWRPWSAADLSSVDRFEGGVGARAQIVMWYADWRHSSPRIAQLRAVGARGSIPEITWEPWDASKGLYRAQPAYRLQNIIDGKFDSYIRSWARTLAAYHQPVLLRLAQEMDGNWYPWGERANGNQAGEFVRAWRHVHDIFTRAGATNVKWVWSPAFSVHPALFPGKRYVDVLGLTCLNSGRTGRGGAWRSFAAICAEPIAELHALDPTMPIQLSETGTTASGGSRSVWISGMFAFLRAHPEVSSVVWFDLAPGWSIAGSRGAQRQFAAGLSELRRARAASPAPSAARSAATSRSPRRSAR